MPQPIAETARLDESDGVSDSSGQYQHGLHADGELSFVRSERKRGHSTGARDGKK
jgi:hypothetical protein